ncbi:DUF3578 domain-containing protein [Domibacillus sp. DTU_2020_1001157_1_SI_ALB_TIR_016]|uniref:MrcB family domain-containing protein n=1 Tax=Domibacillus sp. DTU_2020_1001157_1_SI_ALB_TIR_016 TaxID=3077789 RepID=UPI0028F02C42|nr:DUF3578 domain-containing protein [Domibacillus sp. DTU_2020_1001157_1_SI_ALB_TIR_016]WNS82217.1 DUF3578 domain-containing protein [Domibacillus sp. DTU_2020_1001157_1_SI_ALB_TIR_016]
MDFKTTPLSLRPLPFDKTVFPNDPRTSIQIFTNSSRPAKYEAANILGKEYDMEYIQNSDLEGDLTSLVRVYNEWVNSILTSDLEDRYQESISGSSNENNEIKHEETVPPDRLNRLQVRSGSLHPPRNRKEGDLAIKLADFLCEMDSDHRTFNLSGGKQFMEKHHLIPMEQYFNFEKSVDHYLNIYSLCPTCHRKIHYGEKEDRKEMLEILYGMRKTNYQEIYGIQLNDLFRYYNV